MEKIKILVVTATLGKRESLNKTISSVKSIKYDNIKHIIITPEECIKDISNKYDIECIPEDKRRKGIYGALNHAFFTLAKDYDYITFLNDDDYWLPNFKLIIERAQEGYDFIYGKVNFILEKDNNKISPMACSNQFKDFIPLLHNNIVLLTQQATLIKTELFFKLNGFNENYKLVSDTLFWAQLSMLKIKFSYIPKACAAYLIQEGQLSSNKELQKMETLSILRSLPQCSKYSIIKASIIFRIKNIKVYLKKYFS